MKYFSWNQLQTGVFLVQTQSNFSFFHLLLPFCLFVRGGFTCTFLFELKKRKQKKLIILFKLFYLREETGWSPVLHFKFILMLPNSVWSVSVHLNSLMRM